MQIKSVAVGSADHPVAQLALDLGLDYARTDWEHRDPRIGSDWEHGVPAEQLWWDSYVVQAESLAEARTLLPLFRSEGRAQRFVLVIRGLFPAGDLPVWTPRSLQVKAAASAMTVPGLGFAVVVEGGKWVNVHAAALAALGCCSPATPRPVLGGLRVGFTEPAASAWLAGDALGSFMTEQLLQPEPDDIYSVDVLIGRSELTQQLSEQIAVHPGRVTPPVWTPPGTVLPPVDTAVVSPMGFLPYPEKPARALEPGELGPGGDLQRSRPRRPAAARLPRGGRRPLRRSRLAIGAAPEPAGRRRRAAADTGVVRPGAVPARPSAGGLPSGFRRRRPAGAAGIEVDRASPDGPGPLQPEGRLEHPAGPAGQAAASLAFRERGSGHPPARQAGVRPGSAGAPELGSPGSGGGPARLRRRAARGPARRRGVSRRAAAALRSGRHDFWRRAERRCPRRQRRSGLQDGRRRLVRPAPPAGPRPRKGLQRRHPGRGPSRIRVPGKPGHHHAQAPARRAVLGPRCGRHHDARPGRAASAGGMAARPSRRRPLPPAGSPGRRGTHLPLPRPELHDATPLRRGFARRPHLESGGQHLPAECGRAVGRLPAAAADRCRSGHPRHSGAQGSRTCAATSPAYRFRSRLSPLTPPTRTFRRLSE